MAFDLAASVKPALVIAICVALATYISCNLLKPHLVTRQNTVDPNLVNTYTAFTAMIVLIAVFLQSLFKHYNA